MASAAMIEATVVEGMQDYYAQRAAYYERVYFKPERQTDLRAMEAWLPGVFAGRRVLEIACGTGWWTPHGARDAAAWLATDLNPGTMAVARAKAMPACVEFAEVDAYSMAGLGSATFDAAFAGCWWSHVPLQRLPGWLGLLHQRLEAGARVVMLDNSYVQTSSTPLSRCDAEGNTYQSRSLDDGSVHEVLKNFPTREQAIAMLGPRARDPEWIDHEHYWLLTYLLS
jgi:demethylmenaquinone methyltransferase/2-methoxy-6-polyprenyl-1,4-benzoquinol methylase